VYYRGTREEFTETISSRKEKSGKILKMIIENHNKRILNSASEN